MEGDFRLIDFALAEKPGLAGPSVGDIACEGSGWRRTRLQEGGFKRGLTKQRPLSGDRRRRKEMEENGNKEEAADAAAADDDEDGDWNGNEAENYVMEKYELKFEVEDDDSLEAAG
ncbi:unnamed protein product [Protopolystoma xenopodis]|uniref:Uncharacterized protein n=1 Tax=Protopolystoma xenopodis TaxID=117903 RepID=A0A3S5AC49_9PLAT|nr:unnamed protein product [Protopolystoma xenopodis]